jgi:hypothetical protein
MAPMRALQPRVTNNQNLPVDTDEIAAQIFASRLRYLQLLATSKALMARAEKALCAEPTLLSSADHAPPEVADAIAVS